MDSSDIFENEISYTSSLYKNSLEEEFNFSISQNCTKPGNPHKQHTDGQKYNAL